MSAVACLRCGEELVDPARDCEFCKGEREEKAIRTLVSAARFSDGVSTVARVDAIDTLRSLGYSDHEVLLARARALDGWTAGQILDELQGKAELEDAVA